MESSVEQQPDKIPYPQPASAAVTAKMKANRRVDTRPERAIRSLLHARGLRFRKDFAIRAGGRVRHPDIVFTRQRVAVYIDGCFWHFCPEHGRIPSGPNEAYWAAKLDSNRRRDLADAEALTSEGWLVLRFWEHELPDVAADAVQAAVASRRR